MAVRYIECPPWFDRPVRLRFDVNAIALVEDTLKMGIGQIFSSERIGFSTLRALYWAAMQWENRGLTLNGVGNMIQKAILEHNVSYDKLAEPVAKALAASGLFQSAGEDFAPGNEEPSEETPTG